MKGRVTSEDGIPLAYVTVCTLNGKVNKDTSSDCLGLFSLDELGTGTVTVVAGRSGFQTSFLEGVPCDTEDIVISLKRASKILGTFKSPSLPQRWEVIFARVSNTGSVESVSVHYSNPQSPATFKADLKPGKYKISLNAEEFELANPMEIIIGERAEIHEVTLSLKPAPIRREVKWGILGFYGITD